MQMSEWFMVDIWMIDCDMPWPSSVWRKGMVLVVKVSLTQKMVVLSGDIRLHFIAGIGGHFASAVLSGGAYAECNMTLANVAYYSIPLYNEIDLGLAHFLCSR